MMVRTELAAALVGAQRGIVEAEVLPPQLATSLARRFSLGERLDMRFARDASSSCARARLGHRYGVPG